MAREKCVAKKIACLCALNEVQASKEFIHRGCVVDGLCLFVCVCLSVSSTRVHPTVNKKNNKKKHTPSLHKTW